MKPWHLVAACVAGIAIGFGISGHDVQKLEKAKVATVSSDKLEARADSKATLNVAQVLPGKETIRWKIKYRPAVDGGCEIDEASGESDKTAPGSIVISSDQAARTETSRASEYSVLRETLRIDTPAPTWSVAVLGGASLRAPTIAIPGAPHVVIGVHVERKIAGPFKAGAWALSSGVAGLSLGARW